MKYQEKKVRQGKFEVLMKYNFDYKNNKFGRIFAKENLHKYSSKMAKICDIITKSNGIILIYSQFIDGGVVPMALALEEMVLTRFSSESYAPLLKTTDTDIEPIDSITFEKKTEYETSPIDQAGKYKDHGFKNLHIVDLDGALTGKTVNLNIIKEIVSKYDLKIEIGGGVRSLNSIKQYIDAGVEKVILGSGAIKNKEFLKEACE